MTDTAFTARNVTKFVVKSIVAHQTKGLVATAISDYTEYEEDAFGVQLGAGVVGWAVSDKLKPVTDKIVDTTFNFVSNQRTKCQAKKNNTEETEND